MCYSYCVISIEVMCSCWCQVRNGWVRLNGRQFALWWLFEQRLGPSESPSNTKPSKCLFEAMRGFTNEMFEWDESTGKVAIFCDSNSVLLQQRNIPNDWPRDKCQQSLRDENLFPLWTYRGKKASMSHKAISHRSQGKSSFLCSQAALPQQLCRCFSCIVIC